MDSSVAAQNVTTRARVARAATATTSAPKAANSTAPAVAARAAKTAPVNASTKNTAAPKNTAKPVVAARAGATQRVITTGGNVSAAATNSVVNAECQQKYNGCMDAFCILENANGGRCQCNDKIKTLDAIAVSNAPSVPTQKHRRLGNRIVKSGPMRPKIVMI